MPLSLPEFVTRWKASTLSERVVAQAVHFEAGRLGSIGTAEANTLKATKAAQSRGSVRSWKFWFLDGGYRTPIFLTAGKP